VAGTATPLTGAGTLTLQLNNLTAGTYEFELKATDNSNSSASDRVRLIVNPIPPNKAPVVDAGAGQAIVLPATNVVFNGTATDSDGTITGVQWTKQSGPNVTLTDATTMDLTVSNLTAGFYVFRLSVTDNSGNVGIDDAILVVTEEPSTVNQPPVVYAGPDTTFVAPLTSITVLGEAIDIDGGIIAEYEWTQTAGTPVTFQANSSVLVVEDIPVGMYEFTLSASDEEGNVGTDKMILTVIDKESNIAAFIPKYFSPNNDGFNDRWIFKNTEVVKDCNLTVYTREGKMVYETVSYDNSWDGSFNGRKLSNGDYYYVIKYNGDILASGGVRIIQ
jgi:gliding motility-associated-like protein